MYFFFYVLGLLEIEKVDAANGWAPLLQGGSGVVTMDSALMLPNGSLPNRVYLEMDS